MDEMGMMGGMGMGGAGALSAAEAKKKMKTLTRTDFLIQFVWQPVKPDEQPKTDEERKEKLTKIRTEMTEAEKNNPAVTIPKEDELDAVSRKQSQAIDSAITKALTGSGGAPTAPGALPASPAAGGPAAAPPSTSGKAAGK
jgi:type IV pilus assembly protein PilM